MSVTLRRARQALGLLLAAALAAAGAHAQDGEQLLAPAGPNLYRVEGKNIYVQTLACAAASQRTRAVLMYNNSGESSVLVTDGSRCAVKSILAPTTLPLDRFSVMVTTRASEWHELFGKNAFVKTSMCFKVVFAQTVVLKVLAKDDMRLIFPDGKTCTVEQVYGPMR